MRKAERRRESLCEIKSLSVRMSPLPCWIDGNVSNNSVMDDQSVNRYMNQGDRHWEGRLEEATGEKIKKVMLITTIFPPSWGPGVHRISKLYKYLPDFGYFPVVLTTTEHSYGIIDGSVNFCSNRGFIIKLFVLNGGTLLSKFRVKSKNQYYPFQIQDKYKFFNEFTMKFLKNIYNMFFIPDDRMFWIPLAIIKGYWMIKKFRVELLYSTSPHVSAQVVGFFLKRLTGLPWVVDFRDPWQKYHLRFRRFYFHRLFDDLFLKSVVKNSSKIVSVSEPLIEELRKRYSDIDSNKFDVIPNSFDPDDFTDLSMSQPFSNKFIISHAGTFYGQRSPDAFLIALTKLLKQKPHWRNKIDVFFVGSFPQNRESIALLDPLRDVVTFIPFLPYKEMLQFLTRSTLLLLIPGPGEGIITGKVFDYLGLKKPIFLLSQGNTALEGILKRTQNSIIAPYDAIEKIVESLTVLIQAFFEGKAIKMQVNEEEKRLFTSIEMARKFSRIMDKFLKAKTNAINSLGTGYRVRQS